MWFIGKWVKAYKSLKESSRPNDFVKLFNIEDGQVLVEMDFPQYQEESYDLIQTTVVVGKVKGKITSSFPTEALLRQAYEAFDVEKAIKFNSEIQKLL